MTPRSPDFKTLAIILHTANAKRLRDQAYVELLSRLMATMRDYAVAPARGQQKWKPVLRSAARYLSLARKSDG